MKDVCLSAFIVCDDNVLCDAALKYKDLWTSCMMRSRVKFNHMEGCLLAMFSVANSLNM